MSTNSNNRGRAYEYAWMKTLYKALSAVRKTRVVNNSSLEANQRAWNVMDDEMQRLLETSANAGIDMILELEPRMSENDGVELLLEFQKDEAGTKGDVRDIVIKGDSSNWEVGLSIKHNHEAVKHSRLSQRLDFGKEWFGIPCSAQYWTDVKPVFDRLKQEKSKKKNWADILEKDEEVYVPLLQAFMDEIQRDYQTDAFMSKKMVEYLIGTDDYYKIVSHDKRRKTSIQTFNLHGSLNQPGKKKKSPHHVPIVELPTELVAMKFKTGSRNTVEMYLNK